MNPPASHKLSFPSPHDLSGDAIPNAHRVALRWTIGDVRPRGFELLRLSITSAFRLFGPSARYTVCVNTISAAEGRARTGALPITPEWRHVTRDNIPHSVRAYFDRDLIGGMGCKLAPIRTHPDRYELALDNDVILWALPDAMRQWLSSPSRALFAEDVQRFLGNFDHLCPPGAFNAGIRGLAPGIDLAPALEQALRDSGLHTITDEIDEQGLQAAAVFRLNPFLVTNREITICSPFWPRTPELGTCGAHFVGMNAHDIPWNYYDRPADDWLEDHWQRHRPALYQKAGLPIPELTHADPVAAD